jgi:hypothetical protein
MQNILYDSLDQNLLHFDGLDPNYFVSGCPRSKSFATLLIKIPCLYAPLSLVRIRPPIVVRIRHSIGSTV